MKRWWVNHKQTFEHEFDGGYIWSPKKKKDGSRNRFYDFLKQVRPGDLVFSYAAGVRGVGVAKSYCYTCPRPNEFGHIGEAWDVVGWRVDVDFKYFPKTIRPKDHLGLLQPILAKEQYAPLRLTGDGLQHIYLTEISSTLGDVLLGLSGMGPVQSGGIPAAYERTIIGQLEWEDQEQGRIEKSVPDSTTRNALVQARVGQGLFRSRISLYEQVCRVTLVDNPAHLIASHIKPWRESNNEERLHAGNGLMLTPSVDHLFDRGFISFEDSGDLIVSPVADTESLQKMGVSLQRPPQRMSFNSDQKYFLDFHRAEILLSASV